MNDTQKTNYFNFIDVVYLAYGKPEYDIHVKNFFDSYKKYNAGYNHNLFIAAKSYENNPAAYDKLRDFAKENNAKIIDLPDDGMEFAAFYRSAKQCTSEYIFFITTNSYILKNDWLKFFVQAAAKNENYKFIGAMGSWGNAFTNIFKKILNKLIIRFSKHHVSQGSRSMPPFKTKLLMLKDTIFNPMPFPNYHIRTNAFLIDKQLYIDYMDKQGFPKTRYDAYKIECGHNSLTNFIKSHGFDVGIVGADAKLYKMPEWDKSETFRNASLKNLIIGDLLTTNYLNSSTAAKIRLEKQTWGYSSTEKNV